MKRLQNGNGRTSRLLLNLELMKSGYPPIVIHVENRLKYYSVLDKADVEKSYDDFIQLIKEEVIKTMKLYLKYL